MLERGDGPLQISTTERSDANTEVRHDEAKGVRHRLGDLDGFLAPGDRLGELPLLGE